ncbi:hypothetical protein SUGI_1013120 [Cryptomeria japonica]|nr:hypothetical protein SUGI_1013120 [Cryptomeria japonica]
MEEVKLRFGARNSADVKLWLISPEKIYERNPVYLHSTILERSEFFQIKMSERLGKTTEQYLEAVRWCVGQETQIRDVLSSLGLKPLLDLAARLDEDDDDHIVFVEGIIDQMVSLIRGRHQVTSNPVMAEKYLIGIFEETSSREVVEVLVCGRVLLRQFKSCIGSRDLLGMRSLFKIIEHCEGEILEAAFMAFVENPEFTKHIKQLAWGSYQQCSEGAFYIINCFMNTTGDRR